MTNPIIKNIKIKGSNTKNHEIPTCPLRQIKFNTHVQKRMYIILNKNTKIVLGTRIEKLPILQLFVFPIFCITIRNNAIIETTKYNTAGAHNSLSDFGNDIIYYFKKIYNYTNITSLS